MPTLNNNDLFQQLRNEDIPFCYDSYSINLNDDEIVLEFVFMLGKKVVFKPDLRIPIKIFFDKARLSQIQTDELFKTIVFHIGLIELVSYWKVTCCKNVIINAGKLDSSQISWLKEVYYNGLGEFFFMNGIETSIQDFMKIDASSGPMHESGIFNPGNSGIIPVGGGKDSAVTLELMRGLIECRPFALNPRKAITDSIECGGYNLEDSIFFYRSIDAELLELNKQGYLNGHTPFSALLGMITLLAAYLTNSRYILLSNESSANEPTIPGTQINHQYSKSINYERSFRDYYKTHISADFEYLSFLRPFNEVQIASLFSSFPEYHRVFRSCNAGSKKNVWCGSCSKCLFAAIILSPFVSNDSIISIFGKDILNDKNLLPEFNKLTGTADEKPFECIGTIEEVNMALSETIKKWPNSDLPFLLNTYIESDQFHRYKDSDFSLFLLSLNNDHFLNSEMLKHLTTIFYDRIPK